MYGFVYITMYGVQCTMYKTTWEWVEINEELHGISSSGNLISNPIKDRGYQLLLQKEDWLYCVLHCIVQYGVVVYFVWHCTFVALYCTVWCCSIHYMGWHFVVIRRDLHFSQLWNMQSVMCSCPVEQTSVV